MDQHLGISINPFIKLFVRNFCFFDIDLVGYHKTRLGLTRDDEIAEVAVVGLDVALAGAEGETLWMS